VSLYIETLGAGEDLVLLHGWGMHGGIWGGVRDALAQVFRLHVVDLPGYGYSAVQGSWTPGRVAAQLAAALPPAIQVCGWSLGGQIALEWALAAPRQIKRLILVAVNPCFVCDVEWRWGVSSTVLEAFAADLREDDEGALVRFLSLQAQGDRAARAVMRQLRRELFRRGKPAATVLAAGLSALQYSDLRACIPSIRQPTLVVHGGNDTLAPLPAAVWLAQHLPAGKLVEIDGASHAPFLSQSALFSRELVDFCHDSVG